jgi:hypothetical protein
MPKLPIKAVLVILGIAVTGCGPAVPDGYSRVSVRLGGSTDLFSTLLMQGGTAIPVPLDLIITAPDTAPTVIQIDATATVADGTAFSFPDIKKDFLINRGHARTFTLQGVMNTVGTAYPIFGQTGPIDVMSDKIEVDLPAHTHAFKALISTSAEFANNLNDTTKLAILVVTLKNLPKDNVPSGSTYPACTSATVTAKMTYPTPIHSLELGTYLIPFTQSDATATHTIGPIFPNDIGKLQLHYEFTYAEGSESKSNKLRFDVPNDTQPNAPAAGQPVSYSVTFSNPDKDPKINCHIKTPAPGGA